MVNLTIVICSFARPEPLQLTLDSIFSAEASGNNIINIRKVIVIDQANSITKLNDRYAEKTHLFKQDNFGGAGGFTRGILEALDAKAEWILLMDDDAIPDASSFSILAKYISKHENTRFALHGAMFSTTEPDTIYEAGAYIEKPETRRFGIVPRLHGYKPTVPIFNDRKLSCDTTVDYGAWWFFCLHSDSVREVGLPLPLFIRGDDREYGLRLKRAGIPTIALPGLRVWHPPHSERSYHWQMLYDWRNTFITKAIYIGGSKGRIGLPWRFFWRTYRMVIGGFYETAELMIAGLEEYLKGPLHCVNAHRETLQRSRFIDGMYSSSGELNNVKIHWIKPIKSWDRLRFAFQMMTFNGLLLPAKRTNGDEISSFHSNQIDWRLTYRLPRFAVAYKGNSSLKIYVRSRSVVRSQIIRLSRITWSYFKNYRSLSEEWKAKAIDFSTEDFWRTYLSIDTR